MKKIIICWAFLLGASSLFAQRESFVEDILRKAHKKMEMHQAISYDIHYSNKPYWSDEINEQFAHCDLVRVESDTIAGGYTWVRQPGETKTDEEGEVSTRPDIEQFYDGKTIYYQIGAGQNARIRIEPVMAGMEYIPNNVLHQVYFLQPDRFLMDTKKATLVNTELCGEVPAFHILIKHPNTEKYRDQTTEIWIAQADFAFIKRVVRYQYQNYDGFEEEVYWLKNVAYDEVNKASFESRAEELEKAVDEDSYRSLKNATNYFYKQQGLKKEIGELIKVADFAPSFSGWNVFLDREATFLEYLGEPMVLYFWNVEQEKSVEQLAIINKISEEYRQEGIAFLGLLKNNETVFPNAIADFLQQKNIHFTNLIIPEEVNDWCGTIGFPEIIVIDKDGKIEHTFVGLSRLNQDILRQTIKTVLK